jgi:hypothetical protein
MTFVLVIQEKSLPLGYQARLSNLIGLYNAKIGAVNGANN